MKGYKATYDMKCNTLTYEVGKTYTISDMLMCSHGFHFCQKQKDVLEFYAYNPTFILLEVEALGLVEHDGIKTLTDSLKIIRVVPIEEYEFYVSKNVPPRANDITFEEGEEMEEETFNEHGTVYSRNKQGDEAWYAYDAKGNEVWRKVSIKLKYTTNHVYEVWKEYDENNKATHTRSSSGYESWSEFDAAGNEIHYKSSNGQELFYEYDDKKNLISFHDTARHIDWKITITE